MNKIEIDIKGVPNSGKTALLVLIGQDLSNAGFKDAELNTDSTTESLCEEAQTRAALKSISGKVNIVVNEVTVRR